MKINTDLVLSPRVLYALMICFVAFAWLAYAYHVDLIFAYDGFLPVIWIDNLSRDFLYTMDMFKSAAFLYIYMYAYQFFNIYPESMVYVVIGLEIAFISWAFFAFTRELFPEAPCVVAVIVVILAIASRARGMDLGRYDEPYFGGLYNNAPMALGMFGIVMYIRGRMLLSSLLLAGSFICHSVRGLIAVLFVAAMHLFAPHKSHRVHVLFPASVFLAITGSWIYLLYHPTNFVGHAIPDSTWFDFAKFGSYHLYPIDMGLFTFSHEERFSQFLSFTLLLAYYLLMKAPSRDLDQQISAALLMMLILTVSGVAISYLQPNPALVKLSLQRATYLFIIVGLVYVVHGLWTEIQSSIFWRKITALGILVAPFVSPPGWPLICSLLIALPPSFQSIRSSESNWRAWTVMALCAVNVGVMLVYHYLHFTSGWMSVVYTGGFRLLLILIGSSFMYALAQHFYAKNREENSKHIFEVLSLLIIVLLASWNLFANRLIQPAEPIKMKRILDYKQAQLWARDNTPEEALFITDPTIYYGWREYSHRSSFGNVREWIHTGWIYSSDYKIYEEGMRRFREFSVNLDEYLYPEPTIFRFDDMASKVRNAYYSQNDQWRLDLARRYGIDYFVMDRNELRHSSSLKTMYQNDSFVILQARLEHKN